MSRIIVKNLPKSISEEKIRELFGSKGTITDVQLKYTEEGKFRQFGFIGYQNENEADEAITYYNNTRINTTKIIVEKCALLGDKNKPKSWSKYATDSSAFKSNNKELIEDEKTETKKKKKDAADDRTNLILEKYKDDPLFEEFLNVHASKETEKLLSAKVNAKESTNENEEENEDEKVDNEEKESEEEEGEGEEDKLANKSISDLEYMKQLIKKPDGETATTNTKKKKKDKEPRQIELFTLKLRDLPYNCKKKDIKHFFKPIVPFTVRLPRNVKGIAYVGFKLEKQSLKALLKDKSFINGKQIAVAKYNLTNPEKEEEKVDPKKIRWKNQEEALKNEEDIAESGNIFVRNLSYTTTEKDIQELFEKYGPVTEVNLPIDTVSRQLKGFGTITFLMPEHAVKAYSELDGSVLHGRMLHLLPGKMKEGKQDGLDNDGNFKSKKVAKQRAQAGSGHNWNALFLGHDAVADVMASQYGTSKETVLNPHGDGSAAVRLALGETQIVTGTRKYLEEQGVFLDAFAQPNSKRSKTIILVKNLPANTDQREIRDMFQPHGMIGRIIFPPSGISCIVEFIEPSEARKAFTRLAYTKFKNLPLYLEWAPENTLDPNSSNSNTKDSSKNTPNTDNNNISETKIEEKIEVEEDNEEHEEPEDDTTLFVKNLHFDTTDNGMNQHFRGCGKIHYARVALKKDMNNPTLKLSMGYGFVRFVKKASADNALKTLQQSILDGKPLELKRSERTLQNDVNTSRAKSKKTKQTGTKILVRNIPFQANIKEVSELFRVFGETKALRLPKKMSVGSNSHRGFAFVDYVTNADAKKAFEALSQSTHLYGRRLVLEWATTDEGVDEIRKRTADHFHQETEVQRSKKSIFTLDE